MQRLECRIHGVVQGIGFRPLVYRIAQQLALTGWILNDGAGVQLQVQGERVMQFPSLIKDQLSELADIETFIINPIDLEPNELEFKILASTNSAIQTEFVPDLSICKKCTEELFDKNSRFYLYPFINCTQCGARYTITKNLPYDRAQTTMRDFTMCECCAAEYNNPESRRFHAEPIACNLCGPSYEISLEAAAKKIRNNEMVALKALGGYQLIANGFSADVTKQIREKKQRPFKPFAVMLFNLASIKEYYHVNAEEEKLLQSSAKPIVLLKIKKIFNEWIAPGLNEHGVMLPYTGMHYCLFYYYLNNPNTLQREMDVFHECLIVTSGNLSGQALICDPIEAKATLSQVTENIISHDRKILLAADDSIVKIIDSQPAVIRRARGFVPKKIHCAKLQAGILALGCHLKNTICLTRAGAGYVSQYLGTLQSKSNIDFMQQTLVHMQKLFNISINTIAHDQHPDIYTTQFATSFDLPTVAVQHHHAHVASVMAEYQLDKPVLAWVLDGFGYANANEAWGGELLWVDGAEFKRISHLRAYPLLGGDKAAKEPWRMALSILHSLDLTEEMKLLNLDQSQIQMANQAIKSKITWLQSSSCGRYFDAASALLNICQYNTFENEAAMRLEAYVTNPTILKNAWTCEDSQLDFSELWRYLLTVDQVTGANTFHGTLAEALVETALEKCHSLGIKKFILSGGCLQNKIFAEMMIARLQQYHIEVYYPRQLPCNDGGLSLGQAWVASHLLMRNS